MIEVDSEVVVMELEEALVDKVSELLVTFAI